MLLGKRPRPRPPMRRTTSMTEFAPDLELAVAPPPAENFVAAAAGDHQSYHQHQSPRQRTAPAPAAGPGPDWLGQRLGAAVAPSPRQRRSSGDIAAVETAAFLKACGLCKRRLGPGRDIFMYRGEIAFCSLECRQQQMTQDERKEKCALTSVKKEVQPMTTASDAASSGETVAAA